MEQVDGTTKRVLCDEPKAALAGCTGNRTGGQECGIRICNQKYMFLKHQFSEGINYAILSRRDDGDRKGGGAIIAKTK